MTERKWTAGPWVITEAVEKYPFIEVSVKGNPEWYMTVATAFGATSGLHDTRAPAYELTANAHLIAAAPDLYEALEPLEEEAEFLSKGEEVEDYMLPVTLSVKQYRAIVAALSKARGEVK